MEEWLQIRAFPTYSVSTLGRVANDETGRIMTLLRNQRGIINVGLTRGKVQYKRSVSVLVANAFLLNPHHNAFNTPINLDGDKTNNAVDNLQWRPRWFAVKYFHQFEFGAPCSIGHPIEDIVSGEQFKTSFDAAVKYGLLDREIHLAILNNTYVWPTFQRFREV